MSNFKLKIFALLFMTIDHIGFFLPASTPLQLVMRTIGRLSFPIYLFLILEGYKHTSDRKNYIKSLYVFAIISTIPFYICFGHIFNVFFTLGTVVLMLYVLDKYSNCTYDFLLFLAFAYVSYKFDWGLPAIMTVFFLRHKIYDTKSIALLLPIVLTASTLTYFSITGNIGLYILVFTLPILGAIPFLLKYNGTLGYILEGNKKYFMYIYYPLHLLLIAFAFDLF